MKFASIALCAFGCLIKFKVDEVGKILLTKTFQLSWIVLAEPEPVRSLLPVHPEGWGLLANCHWKAERSHLSCFSCSQKRVTEGMISHRTQGVWTAGCLFLPLASPWEEGMILHCIPSGSSNHMAVEFLLQLLDLMHQDINVFPHQICGWVHVIAGFCAERAGVCNLKAKRCTETGSLFCVTLLWTIVLAIYETLYFIPVENCVIKLHYISCLILEVSECYFQIIVSWAFTRISAVRLKCSNIDICRLTCWKM